MGLFDGFVDPQQFNSGGGLLGRLLALQQFQGQYQPDAGFDQASSAPQTPSPASILSPLLSNYGQPAQTSVNWQNSVATGGDSDSQGPTPSTAAPNAVMAQYAPARPMGIPLPPVFLPGTPENDAFVHSTINAGRAIGNTVGNVLNSDSNENPVPGTTPEAKTKGRSSIFQKPGGYDDAVKDFNGLNPTNVRPLPKGGLTGILPDGRNVNVRPTSSDGRPTVEVQDKKKSTKTRYGDK